MWVSSTASLWKDTTGKWTFQIEDVSMQDMTDIYEKSSNQTIRDY